MKSTGTLCHINYGDVFEFHVNGRFYYFQTIYWNVKRTAYRVIKLYFDGTTERPKDIESYLLNTKCDYYSYDYCICDDFEVDEEQFNKTFSYVGCYPPEEVERWKNDAPPFRIEGWPADVDRSRHGKTWSLSVDYSVRIHKEEIQRIREEWITASGDSLDYRPLWRIRFGCRAIFFHSLPESYMLDVPIYTNSLRDEIRFYLHHSATPREYFLRRSSEIRPEILEERVIAAKIASANCEKLECDEINIAKKFEQAQGQKALAISVDEQINRRFEVFQTNDNFRTDLSFGDVFEIHKGRKLYYFQTIRPINFYDKSRETTRPEPYFLIRLLYARFNKRPTDLAEAFNSFPSQILVSRIRYSDAIEYVGAVDASSVWFDEDPRFFLYFDPTFLGWNACPNEHVVIVRADRPIFGSYFYEAYYTGCSFPSSFRKYPILCPVDYDQFRLRNEQFSVKAIDMVDYFLKRGTFKIDEVWSQNRILAWAQRAQRELHPDYTGESSEFVAYKHTATDLRNRVKKLVGMQRRRKQFSRETLSEFESILTEFVESIVGKKDDKKNIQNSAKSAIRKLNRANDKLDQSLIETEEREELFQFFFDAGSYVGVNISKTIEDARDW